jgi:hypothetical protein
MYLNNTGRYLFLILTVFCSAIIYGQKPVEPLRFWTFDNTNALAESKSGTQINIRDYKCDFQPVKGGVGNGAQFGGPASCLATTQTLSKNVTNEFTIEFLFKGNSLSFTSFSTPDMVITFTYPRIQFRTTTDKNGKKERDELVISLEGSGRNSYNYYTDGKWHHLVFTASTSTGIKQVWVDGSLQPGFEKKIPAGGKFVFSSNDAFKGDVIIDELAIYNKRLSPGLIQQHYRQVSAGTRYTFIENAAIFRKSGNGAAKNPELDPRDFAPGYPAYNVQLYNQLKSFPLPRYKPGVKMKRLVSWMDMGYLHRELQQAGGKGFGKSNAEKGVLLSREMAENWNYYLDIPTLRTDAASAKKIYSDKSSWEGALVHFANSNPQYPWSTILIQVQGKPVQAGFERPSAYVTAQDLPAKYYIKDGSGKPVVYNGKKWLSPLLPLDGIEKDGMTSRFYLQQLTKYLNRPPALINENGEHFGHTRPEILLTKDANVLADFRKSGLSLSCYSGRFQYRLDSTYKAAVLKGFDARETHFSFYNNSALQPDYWPCYKERRLLNRLTGNTCYPTPDFYPAYPANWRLGSGALNGYGNIAFGRVAEINLGDKLFSPFVSAGWATEEKNIRPAQWLSLLKAMVMLGTDFFYVGYFNVTGAGGKWPNGAGPNDPRGYAYQVALPAYAQALGSHAWDFITQGELLNPADAKDQANQYRFKGNAENELILVRKLGKKYLIYGSIQPNSNVKGNVPEQVITRIRLDNMDLRFAIRKQGSMYILDLSNGQRVFYQLDGWHDASHPWYWSKESVREAEIPDNQEYSRNLRTEQAGAGEGDFSKSIAYFKLNNNKDIPGYVFEWRTARPQYCFVRARVRNGKQAVMQVSCKGQESKKGSITVATSGWKWYRVKMVGQEKPLQTICSDNNPVTLTLQLQNSGGAEIDVDKIIFREKADFPTE